MTVELGTLLFVGSGAWLPAILLVGAHNLCAFVSKIKELNELLLSEVPFSSDSWLFYSPVYWESSGALWEIPKGFTKYLVKRLSSYSPSQGSKCSFIKGLMANILSFARYHCLCHRHEVPSSVTMRTATDNMQINGHTCILIILYYSITMGWPLT